MDRDDFSFLNLALDLAKRGRGLTSPNPMVGAVLVKDGAVVGEGFHTYLGRKHAEALAIEQAGERSQGATLYVNLEPCNHAGRTPPCTELILRAGVRRVIMAMQDPNPLVCGSGLRRLQQAGIAASLGALESEARKLNEAFCKYIVTRHPFVTLKAGMTLDGKIADASGASRWITSETARQKVQELRFENDALLTGINTVLKDDPLLTDRSGLTRRRPLLRVVLDSHLRMPLQSQLVGSLAQGGIIVFCSSRRDSTRERALQAMGIEVIAAPEDRSRVDLHFVLAELGRREITSLLVEGGSEVNFEALSSGMVDKLALFVAPKILGGREPYPLAGGRGFPSLADSLPLSIETLERVGPDIMLEAYVQSKDK